LKISDNVKIVVNQEKINEEEKWDGLKGYLTNTDLPAKDIYEQYKGIMGNRTSLSCNQRHSRIATHVSFYSQTHRGSYMYLFCRIQGFKELERILKLSGINLSVDKVLNIAKTITIVMSMIKSSKLFLSLS